MAAKPDRATARPAARNPSAAKGPVRATAPPPASAAIVPVAVGDGQRAEAPRRQRISIRRPDTRVKSTDRVRPQPEQRSKQRREGKLLRRERKAGRKLHPARPGKRRRLREERSARRPPAVAPTPKAPRKAKRPPQPVATTTPVAEPTLTPDPPEVENEAKGKSR